MAENIAEAISAPLGRHYEVPSGQVLLHRSGTGEPPAVFLAGGGMSGTYYWNAHQRVAERTTSVLYDRLGTGFSDPVPLPRSGTQVTDDLHELLHVADVAGPCVLVGHSLGGLYARLHAKRFPDEVAGLVLLDPTHEDIADRLPEEEAQSLRERSTDDPLSPEQQETMRAAFRTALSRELADWPAEIREPLLQQEFSREGYRRSVREPLNLPRLFDEVRAAGPEPDVPQILVAAMGGDALAEELLPPDAHASLAESNRIKHQLYTDLAAGNPRAELRRLDDTGHSGIAWLRPDAVARAICDVLAR